MMGPPRSFSVRDGSGEEEGTDEGWTRAAGPGHGGEGRMAPPPWRRRPALVAAGAVLAVVLLVVLAALLYRDLEEKGTIQTSVFMPAPMSVAEARAKGAVDYEDYPQDDLDELHRLAVAMDYAFSTVGIDYWVCCGSLLGLERHKGFIPWDYDIDVQVWGDDLAAKAEEIRGVLQKVGFSLELGKPLEGRMGRIVRQGDSFKYCRLHMDVFTLDRGSGRPAEMDNGQTGYFACLEPGVASVGRPEYREFGAMRLKAPAAATRILRKVYGQKWKIFAKGKDGQSLLDLRKVKVGRLMPSDDFMNGEHETLVKHYNDKLKV